MGVKPLLLYYGILSYSRGLILANNHEKKEESLKPRHGLETVDWQNTLNGGIRKVLDLGIRATDGTFRELVDVCWPLQTVHLFNGPTRETVSTGQPLGDVRFATDGSQITLGDLLARLLHVGADSELTGKPAKMFIAYLVSHPPGVHLAFPFAGIPEELRKLEDGKKIHIGSSNQVLPGFRQSDDAEDCLIFSRQDNEAHLHALPVSHYEGGNNMMVISDFPNGDKLTEFIKLYLVSFILGMFVRYHPSMWTALLRNEKGDFAQPLLDDTVEVLENHFVEHLLLQLSGIVRKQS